MALKYVKGKRAGGMAALPQVRPKPGHLQKYILAVGVIALLSSVSLHIYSD